MSDVTRILSQIELGDPVAAAQLLPLIYDDLRRLAAAKIAQEQPGQTLQATALVHESYLRLVGNTDEATSWGHRGHFFAAAAEAMRRILVDSARRKSSQKRGSGQRPLCLDEVATLLPADTEPEDDLLALHEALMLLEQTDPVKAHVVKLRYFGGLTWQEVGDSLGISVATAKRHWTFARAWLFGKVTST